MGCFLLWVSKSHKKEGDTHAVDRVGEDERSEWRRDQSGKTLPWEVEERKQRHLETVSRALLHTGDLLDMKSGVQWQGSPTEIVTQPPSGFHSVCPCFAHTAVRKPLNKTQSLFLLKSLQALYPTQGKTLKSPEATKTLHNLTFALALSTISHSYTWLHTHGLWTCLAHLHPRTFALAVHTILSQPWPSFPQSLLTFHLCILKLKLKRWLLRAPAILPVNLPTERPLPEGPDLCHSHQHWQVLKVISRT